MPGPITPIAAPPSLESIRPAGSSNSGGAFQDVFSAAVKSVEGFNNDATAAVSRFLSGEGEDVHSAALAVER
ncbi:MAG TPA: flagellar hook-basal body complex protein FliE, partial [Bryobacteraceae bacterium]|nr:flagellar hook-basal body complex protein FliE [Bryobacteraceae bacterium]